ATARDRLFLRHRPRRRARQILGRALLLLSPAGLRRADGRAHLRVGRSARLRQPGKRALRLRLPNRRTALECARPALPPFFARPRHVLGAMGLRARAPAFRSELPYALASRRCGPPPRAL